MSRTRKATTDFTGRYSRHKLLREFGDLGQKKISRTRFLIIGAGGVGCPAALCLAEAGVASITIVDADNVDVTNLPRQILHTPSRVGMNKAESAKIALNELNPEVKVTAVNRRADEKLIYDLLENIDIVLDCSDNSETRYAANCAAQAARKTLITVSSIRFSLQIAFFDFSTSGTPCYECVFPQERSEDIKASSVGVFAPVTGISGMIAAGEALKFAAGIRSLAGRLLMIDTLSWSSEVLRLATDYDCPVCFGRP